MNFSQEKLKDLLSSDKFTNLPAVLDYLQGLFECNLQSPDLISSDLISTEILEEACHINSSGSVSLYFGKTLRDLKCVINDVNNSREHEMYFQYKGPMKLTVSAVNLPYSPWQDQEYNSIEEITSAFSQHLERLTAYFHELESIDRSCSVMDPANPSFKEDYRRIVLDDRTWLHIEVTAEGLATNIYLIGQSDYWQDKLQEGLVTWDHDVGIVRNIMLIFDISEFPTVLNKSGTHISNERTVEKAVCSICLCDELPDIPGVPLPLCQNPNCGIYFHINCLFQWLVACAGGRPPTFGVATGSCPTCLQPITCDERG